MCFIRNLAFARSSKRGSGGGAFRFPVLGTNGIVLHCRSRTAELRVRTTSKDALRALQCGPRIVDDLDDASGGHAGLCLLLFGG